MLKCLSLARPIEFASKAGAFPSEAPFVNFGRKKFYNIGARF